MARPRPSAAPAPAPGSDRRTLAIPRHGGLEALQPRHVVWVAAALLAGYLGLWLAVHGGHAAHEDFLATYLGADLLRVHGPGAHLYSLALQADVHRSVTGDGGFFMPFVDAPLTAVLALPLTLLGLQTAFLAWSALQIVLLAAGVTVAVRATPGARGRQAAVACALVALAGFGTSELLHTGQCDGIAAFGIAMTYRSWMKGSRAAGAAWLVATAGIAKPHLALGAVAFALAWRDRRVLAGALGAGVAVALVSVGLVGVDGLVTLVRDTGAVSGRLSSVGMTSFAGLVSRWFNDAPVAIDLTYVGTALGVAACAVAGHRVRRGSMRLPDAFAAVVVIGSLATPHAYIYDLVLLQPAIAWTLASGGFLTSGQRRGTGAVALLWLAVNLVSYVFFALQDFPVVGTPSVYLTVALAVVLWRRAGAVTAAVATAEATPGRRGAEPRRAAEVPVAG